MGYTTSGSSAARNNLTKCEKSLKGIKSSEQLLGQRATWDQPTLVSIAFLNAQTLTKVAPGDPQTVKAVTELTTFTSRDQLFIRDKSLGVVLTTTPFRSAGVRLLGELAETQPKHRKLIIPSLVSILKEGVEHSKQDAQVLLAIAEVELTGDALFKCGGEAKTALVKEVLPRLKDLSFHKTEQVRKAADRLRDKIENAR